VVSSSGAGETVYGYTGEQQSGGLVHLRARDYASQLGRFTSRDTWEGNTKEPISFNLWLYADANPINFIDPTGHYDRQAAVNFAFTHDQGDQFPDDGYYPFDEYPDTQCTIFASSALSIGGYPVTSDWPGYEKTKYELYGISSEEKDKFIGLAAHEGNYYKSGPWVNTPLFYDFLKKDNTVLDPPHNTVITDPVDFQSDDWKNWIDNVGPEIMQGDVVFYVSDWDVKHYGGNFGHVAMVIGWGVDVNRYHDIIMEKNFSYDKSYECAQDRFIDYLLLKKSIRPLVVERSGAEEYSFARAIDNTANIIRKISIIHITK
jgi:RHS repeat-associated protein